MDSPAKPGVAYRSMPSKDENRTRKSLVSFTEEEWKEIVKATTDAVVGLDFAVPPAVWIRLAALEKAREQKKKR